MTISSLLRKAVAITFFLSAAQTAQAAEYTLKGGVAWAGHGTNYTVEGGLAYWVGVYTGAYVDENPAAAGPFAALGAVCPSWYYTGAATQPNMPITAGGYCIFTDGAGDQFFAQWSCSPSADAPPPGYLVRFACNGNWVAGTGKFAGLTMAPTPYTTFSIAFNPDGSFSGVSLWDYRVSLP